VTAEYSPSNRTAGFAPASDCPGPPQTRKFAGLDAQRIGNQTWIAVINRSTQQRIELFHVVAVEPMPRVVWRDCSMLPSNFALDDVALTAERELFATHMVTPPQSAMEADRLRADLVAARPTGYVVRWSAARPWSRMPGTDLSFANGIAVSRDGKWLAAAGTFDQAVLLIERLSGASRHLDVGLQPDNVTPAGAVGFMVASHTGDACNRHRPVSNNDD